MLNGYDVCMGQVERRPLSLGLASLRLGSGSLFITGSRLHKKNEEYAVESVT